MYAGALPCYLRAEIEIEIDIHYDRGAHGDHCVYYDKVFETDVFFSLVFVSRFSKRGLTANAMSLYNLTSL